MSDQYQDHAAQLASHEIGAFASVATTAFDEVADADDLQLVQSLLAEMLSDEREAVMRWVARQKQDAIQEAQTRVLSLIQRVIAFIEFPHRTMNLYGVIYALDLPFHNEQPPAAIARRHGMTRQAISHAMQQAAKIFGLTGPLASRWLRGDQSVLRSSEARNEFCGRAEIKTNRKGQTRTNEKD